MQGASVLVTPWHLAKAFSLTSPPSNPSILQQQEAQSLNS